MNTFAGGKILERPRILRSGDGRLGGGGGVELGNKCPWSPAMGSLEGESDGDILKGFFFQGLDCQ